MNTQEKHSFSTFDFAIILLTLGLLLGAWVYTGFHYVSLPEKIAVHFDGSGNPDGYGNKLTIWLAPIIFTALSIGFIIGAKNPKKFFSYHLKKYTPKEILVNQKIILLSALLLSYILNIIVYSMVVASQNPLVSTSWIPYSIFIALGIFLSIIAFYHFKSKEQ